jgi:hypothetical protein
MWTLNDKLPVVFGTGSVLGFIESKPVDRITVIYKPLMWNVSERIILIESQGTQYAYYPSDMETKIFTDKAVQAAWGGRWCSSRAASSASQPADAGAPGRALRRRPPAIGKGRLEGGVSGVLSAALTLGLLGFLAFHLKGQFKALRFIEPAQVQGSIDDLVGMDDIKSEVRQIKDQYERRTEYAEYGINKPFNVMFSGPAGTGKTKLASYLAKELNLPDPVPLRGQPGDRLRGRRLQHAGADRPHGQAPQALHRVPGRGAGPVHEARRPPQVRRRHAEHAAGHPGRRAHQERGRDHLDRGVQLQQRVHGHGRGHAAPLPDEGGLPPAEQGRAPRHHRALPGPARRQGGAETWTCATWWRSPRAAARPTWRPSSTRRHHRGAGRRADRRRDADAGRRARAGGQRQRNTTKERERDRRIIAIHEWGHFLVDFELERKRAGGDWDKLQAEMKTIKISLKANPRNNALGFVFHKQGNNLLKTKADIEHDVRVLLGGMANEELFFGEEGTTNGAHNDITRVTKLLHHAVAEMGMYRKTRLNFGALHEGSNRTVDEETRSIMEMQSERLYGETKATLGRLKPLTEHLAGKLMEAGEMSLNEALARDPRVRGGLLQFRFEGRPERRVERAADTGRGGLTEPARSEAGAARGPPFFISWPGPSARLPPARRPSALRR